MDKVGLFIIYAAAISSVFSDPQFGGFEIYEVDFQNGVPHTHHYSQGNQPNYNHNHGDHNYGNQNSNYQPGSGNREVYSQPAQGVSNQAVSTSCDNYWTYESDYNEQYGLITIPNPNYLKIVIRITLSLAARLPSVSNLCIIRVE